MANLACSLIVAVLAVELFSRLPFATIIKSLSQTGMRATKVIHSSAFSDHWKEKTLLYYARRGAWQSFLLGDCVLFVAAICTLPVFAGDALGLHTTSFIVAPTGIAAVTALSIGYAIVRSRFV